MKIIYDLEPFGISSSTNKIVDDEGNLLSRKTLDSFLTLISQKYYYKKDQEFVKIHSQNFKRINPLYPVYLKFLEDKGLILISKYYIPGIKSRSYSFSKKFKKFAEIKEIIFDGKGEPARHTYTIAIDKQVDKKLHKDLNDVKIINNKIKKGKLKFKTYVSTCYHTYRIKSKSSFYLWKSGRLYTSFTYCSKDARLNNFTFDGEKLINLDIPNSFPTFLAVWLIENGIDKTDHQFKSFCTEVCSGRINDRSIFYSELKDKLNNNRNLSARISYNRESDIATGYEVKPFTYAQAKLAFQRWLNGIEKKDLLNYLFKSYYSSIYDIVDRAKYKMYDEIVKKETHFMMNIIIKRLYCEIKGIKILTCHDQIYFQEKYQAQVEKVWNEEFKKLYESFPRLPNDDFEIDYSSIGIYEAEDYEDLLKLTPKKNIYFPEENFWLDEEF